MPEDMKITLQNKQNELDEKYAKEGLTDEVLEEQIQINQLRHEHDIPDENQKIHKDYVQ